jgi:hypothetical protein
MRCQTLASVASAVVLVGCASQQQVVDSMQPQAVETAQKRGSFDLGCPAATAQVLSKEMVQAPAGPPRYAPPQRAEFTIGVEGCGKRATYNVVCAHGGTGCVAQGAGEQVHEAQAPPR